MDIRSLVCAVCNHQWSIRADRPNPLRCPAVKCRSTRWESGEDSRAGVKVFTVRCPAEQSEQFERHAKLAGKSVSEWLRDLGAAAVSGPTLSFEDPILKEMIRERMAEVLSSANAQEKSAGGFSNIVRNMAAEVGLNTTYEATMAGISSEGKAINTRKTPAELASSIPELRVGLGPSHVFTDPEIPKALEQLAAMNPPATFFEDRYRDEVGTDPLPKIFFPGDTPEEPVRSWSEEFARCRKLGDFGAEAFAEATEHIKKWPKGFKNWNEQKQVAWIDANHPLDGR